MATLPDAAAFLQSSPSSEPGLKLTFAHGTTCPSNRHREIMTTFDLLHVRW